MTAYHESWTQNSSLFMSMALVLYPMAASNRLNAAGSVQFGIKLCAHLWLNWNARCTVLEIISIKDKTDIEPTAVWLIVEETQSAIQMNADVIGV